MEKDNSTIYVHGSRVGTEVRTGREAPSDEKVKAHAGAFTDQGDSGSCSGSLSADDPSGKSAAGDNELLVVSFGTSFRESREKDIGGIETALQEAYPDWTVRRAFTSRIIIKIIRTRDGEEIDSVEQALRRAADEGVKNLIIQPTHLMHGVEYDIIAATVENAKAHFETAVIAEPLLGETGGDEDPVNGDKAAVAKAVVAQAMAEAGFDDAARAAEDGTALVLMGHGTSHAANIVYSRMQTQMGILGYTNVFVGTVEGKPEETACEVIIGKVKKAGFRKVILRPLMVVAGDHARNDMAGDSEDSWKNLFDADGSFERIDTQLAGLGRISAIQDIYRAHTAAVLSSL